MPSFTCLNCHRGSQHVCGCGCRKDSFYCGKACQNEDWIKRHKYESFLFKARDPVELGSDDTEREKEKRMKIEKARTESELLREQYQEANRLLRKAREEKPRTKREMSMTHTERKRYEFALTVALKEMASENQDDKTREEEFIRGMEELVDDMNVVPLSNGQPREIVLGPMERLEIGHMLMRRRILYLKLALLVVTKSEAVSKETIAFRQMMDDKERRFSFNLFVRESDNITYDEVIANRHREMEKDMIESWIENAYLDSMLGAKEETIKFIDLYRNDPGAKEGYESVIDEEQREKEWYYVKTRMTVAKDCTLQFALATSKNSLSKGLITEEVYLNSTRHYQELSDRIDQVLEEDKDGIVEDMMRMLRRHYGKEWKEVEVFLSGSSPEEGEKDSPLGIITMLKNPSLKKTGWILLTMFALYFFSSAIGYFFGIIGLSFSGASDLDDVTKKGQDLAVGVSKLGKPLTDLKGKIKVINHDITEIGNHLGKVNVTEFHTHVYHGINATTDTLALDTITFTLDRVFKSVQTLFEKKLNSELGKAGREKAGLESLKTLNSYLLSYQRTPVEDYVTRSSILDDISSKLRADSELSTMIGSSQSNDILLSILAQIKSLVSGLNKTTDKLTEELESVTRLSKELNESMTMFDKKYRDKVRSPVIVPLIFGSCNYGYNTQERIIDIYTNGSTVQKFWYSIGDPFVGARNTLIASESYLLQAVDRIPSGIGPEWIVHIVKSVFSVNFLHAQMLLYSVLTDGGLTFGALAIPFVIRKIADRVGLREKKEVVMNKASALMKKILLSCCCCCGTAKEDTIIFDATTSNSINDARKKLINLRAEGKDSFYDFYDLTVEHNLSGHALHALWHNVARLDGWSSREIRLSQLNYYLQNLYYHGVVNWSFLFTGITFYYKMSIVYEVWAYYALKLWTQIVYPLSFIPGVNMLIGFISGFYSFWLITLYLRMTVDVGIDVMKDFIKKPDKAESADKDSDSNITETDTKWIIHHELSILEKIKERIPKDTQKYRDLVYWLKDFGYSALSYYNVIAFLLYWILLTYTMMSKVSDFLEVGEIFSKLKSIFFGGAEITENMKLGLAIKEDYERNITAFQNLATATNETINVVKEYTKKTSFNSGEIVINDFYANLYTSNKILGEVVTKITKTKS